jgi:hypothetical protein
VRDASWHPAAPVLAGKRISNFHVNVFYAILFPLVE